MDSINDRIKHLVDTYCDGNNSIFANRIGVNEANVRNYIKGTEPKFNIIYKIATNFELSFEWLVLGVGNPEKKILNSKTKNARKLVKKNDQENDQENKQKRKVQENWSFTETPPKILEQLILLQQVTISDKKHIIELQQENAQLRQENERLRATIKDDKENTKENKEAV